MSIYGAVIVEQEKVIDAYSQMSHALLNELAQYRNIDAEEMRLKRLDEKGGLHVGRNSEGSNKQ